MFNRDDYMSVNQIAKDWRMSVETTRRWIRKYADPARVEVYGGTYFVHKDEVNRWRAAYEGKSPMRGVKVPFKRVPA